MAIKLANGEYADRPLLTEDELKFIFIAVGYTPPSFSEKDDLFKNNLYNKLQRSILRIDKLKLN